MPSAYRRNDLKVISTTHDDIDLSDVMIAESDYDCLAILFHEDRYGMLTCYEVWNDPE